MGSDQRINDQKCFKEFLFGHRDDHLGDAKSQAVRWVHLQGCHVATLLGLTAKYRVHPSALEDVVEQHASKMDRYGAHYFFTIEHLCCRNFDYANTCMRDSPVSVVGRHVSILCAGAPSFSTFITVVQPDQSFTEDWPGAHDASPLNADYTDAWVNTLRERLKSVRSRAREHRTNYLLHQVIDLIADDFVIVAKAFSFRLAALDRQLDEQDKVLAQDDAEGRVSSVSVRMNESRGWCKEVSNVQLQLGVFARRARNLKRMVGNIVEDQGLSAHLARYFKDVIGHIDEVVEDAGLMVERCRSYSYRYELLVDRAAQRHKEQVESSERSVKVEKGEQERIRKQREDAHNDELNNTLFVLTVATTIFAPVQFLGGVYGMNFVDANGTPTIPELLWPHGYLYFWIVVVVYLILAAVFATWLFRHLRLYREQRRDGAHDDSLFKYLRKGSLSERLSGRRFQGTPTSGSAAYVALSGGPT